MIVLAGSMLFTSCKKQYTITVQSNNVEWGYVVGGGQYESQASVTLQAIPNEGYQFERWDDGSKENPRLITVTGNQTFMAYFKEADDDPVGPDVETYTITVVANDATWGTVVGGGTYPNGATTTLAAMPNNGYLFEKWQDGVTENPRNITVTANATYVAYFKVASTPPVSDGVSVNFGGSNWTTTSYQGAYYQSYGAWDVFSYATSSSEYPMVDVATYTTGVGNYTDATSDGQNYDNGVVAWIEYYENATLQDQQGYTYGDWWVKNATINVTVFDPTSLTLSANVNATMFDAYSAFVDGNGFNAAPTTNMTVNMTNVHMESAKKSSMKKISKKVVAAR